MLTSNEIKNDTTDRLKEIASQREDLECGQSFSAREIQRERFLIKDRLNY